MGTGADHLACYFPDKIFGSVIKWIKLTKIYLLWSTYPFSYYKPGCLVAPLATMLGTSVSLLLMFLARRFGQISSPVQEAHRSSSFTLF
jgi:hypothetical protein